MAVDRITEETKKETAGEISTIKKRNGIVKSGAGNKNCKENRRMC